MAIGAKRFYTFLMDNDVLIISKRIDLQLFDFLYLRFLISNLTFNVD